MIHSQGMQYTGRANHSAHCCRQGGAVDPDGDKRRPYIYFLEEPVVLNQQSPEAERGNITSYCFDCSSSAMVWKSSTRLFRPVTGGADQEEEENVDREGVQDSHNGALRDGNARGLQLACGRAGRKDTWRCVLTHDKQKIDSEFKEKSNKNI